jgi:hypothetical protein
LHAKIVHLIATKVGGLKCPDMRRNAGKRIAVILLFEQVFLPDIAIIELTILFCNLLLITVC